MAVGVVTLETWGWSRASIGYYFYKAVVKRALDILVAIPMVILTLPVLAAVKIAYLATGDRASIVYKQERIGENGRRFKMYKIRTMVPNAEVILARMLREDGALRTEWAASQKLAHDPRITKVGRILRKGSIDEMPQFLNVLFGQISLVGPRPLVPGELEQHYGAPEIYQSVKPGMTGWWAVSGRSETDYDERLNLEYYYITHLSLSFDALVILKTAKVVLKGIGAK